MLFSKRTDATIFFGLYFVVASYFSQKMIRLVLILAPASSAATGAALGFVLEWSVLQFTPSSWLRTKPDMPTSAGGCCKQMQRAVTRAVRWFWNLLPARLVRKAVAACVLLMLFASCLKDGGSSYLNHGEQGMDTWLDTHVSGAWTPTSRALRQRVVGVMGDYLYMPDGRVVGIRSFWEDCQAVAPALSEPQIMLLGESSDGDPVVMDDFREAYWWLRDQTPEDARIMAWWDYGYQISGIGNRTTIADGNTWNHEHIALLGKCLTSPQRKAHSIVRHLAGEFLRHCACCAHCTGRTPLAVRPPSEYLTSRNPGTERHRVCGMLRNDTNRSRSPVPGFPLENS